MYDKKILRFVEILDKWIIEPKEENFDKVVDILLDIEKDHTVKHCDNLYLLISLLKDSNILAGYIISQYYKKAIHTNTVISINKLLLELLSEQYNPTYVADKRIKTI